MDSCLRRNGTGAYAGMVRGLAQEWYGGLAQEWYGGLAQEWYGGLRRNGTGAYAGMVRGLTQEWYGGLRWYDWNSCYCALLYWRRRACSTRSV